MSDNGTGKNLTVRQVKAITALLTGKTVSQAAESAGVGRSSLYRWLADPAFKTGLAEAEAAALAELSRQLVALARGATANLAKILADETAGPGHKLRASDIILTNLLRLRELIILEQRVSELERKFNDRSH